MAALEELTGQVTIHRDRFGVPHVSGVTDEAAMFGSALAQSEDNFPAVETAYLRVLGRLAEKEGPRAFWSDLVARALELPRLSVEEYRRVPRKTAALCEAFAAGLNLYLHTRKPVSVIQRFHPWYVLALHRLLHLSAFHALGIQPAEMAEALHWIGPQAGGALPPPQGDAPPAGASFACAVGPAKSANGTAMLLSVSHVEFGSLYELHLTSEQGLDFAGPGFWGMPLPMMGISPSLGWALTASRPPIADLFRADGATGKKRAVDWSDVLLVKTPASMERRTVCLRRNGYGPILAIRCGVPFAARIAHLAEGGLFQQLMAMAKSTSLRQFRSALSRRALVSHNVMYADACGNIFYVYNGAVPRRSKSNRWHGYHELSELPQVRNPRGGFLQNSNSSPFHAALSESPNPSRFPAYLNTEPDTAQARILRGIAASVPRFSFDDLAKLAFDRRVYQAPEVVAAITAEWESLRYRDKERARKVSRAVEALRRWDCISSPGSTAMTLLVAWMEASATLNPAVVGEWPAVAALETAIEDLQRRWGKWNVPWGRVNRLQRPTGPAAYDDDRPSLPIAGGPRAAGIPFTFESVPVPGQLRRYGIFGNAYVFAAEFGSETKARSIAVFGQSADPQSRHFFDQATWYRRGKLKPLGGASFRLGTS